MIISPRPANEANANRPQFIVFRQSSEQTFDYYWQTITNSKDQSAQAAWKKMF